MPPRVQHRRELPAQFLMQWNAAKAQWPAPQDSPEPYDGSAPRPRRPKPVAVGSAGDLGGAGWRAALPVSWPSGRPLGCWRGRGPGH